MNKSIIFLLTITILVPGCFGETTSERAKRFDSFEEQRLYRLLVETDIDTIIVDIDYVGNRRPPQIAIEAIRENLETVAPHVEISIPEPTLIVVNDDSPNYVWNLNTIIQLSAVERQNEDKNHNAVIHIMVLNGKDEDKFAPRIGFFFTDFIVIFPDALVIDNQPELIRGAMVHELGHAVGLVDFGVPMMTPRIPSEKDDPCQCHSTQEDSPLYYKFSSTWLLEKIEDGKHIPYIFNKDDLADIEEFKKRHKD